MDEPTPPQIASALEQVRDAIKTFERKDLDLLRAPWAEIEKSIIKILGGAFEVERPEHQAAALGLAGAFAARLIREHQAFWFPHRDSIEGAALGFPEALIMLSPFGAVADALRRARLEKLEEVAQEIRRALAQAKFSPDPARGQVPRLDASDYQRLFDPGFLQFVVFDVSRAKEAWEKKPDAVATEIRTALGRASRMPAEAKDQFELQMVTALKRLDPARSLVSQIDRGMQAVELVGHLFGTVQGTGFAPEEFWQEIALPLLFIGSPDSFPPIEKEELDAFEQGVDPLALFVDLVPFQSPAPEEGLLGVFPQSDIGLPHPAFAQAAAVRFIQLKREGIAQVLGKFDPQKTRATLARFVAYLEQKAGKPVVRAPGTPMLDAALGLLSELKTIVDASGQGKGELAVRRVTETEATSENALGGIREALRAPRIILA